MTVAPVPPAATTALPDPVKIVALVPPLPMVAEPAPATMVSDVPEANTVLVPLSTVTRLLPPPMSVRPEPLA